MVWLPYPFTTASEQVLGKVQEMCENIYHVFMARYPGSEVSEGRFRRDLRSRVMAHVMNKTLCLERMVNEF